MGKIVGIDIGGTNVKAGVFSEGGTLEATAKIPTGSLTDAGAFAAVTEGLETLLGTCGARACDVVGVGLDVPGPVDENGNVGMLPNLQLDVPRLKKALADAFPQAKLAFANDVNAAALGELWQGAARDVPSFALVALGTGVGGAVVVSGKLVAGSFGAGGELGHLTVNRHESAACGCGKRGCLEQYASAAGVVRAYLRACAERGTEPVPLDGPTDTLSVFAAHRAGDEAARAAVTLMCDSLGFAMAQVSAVVDPALYLVGGGMGEGFALFADELRAAFRAYCLPMSASARIEAAALGNRAALYGCAFLALGR